MSLYEDWQALMNGQTDKTVKAFWQEYSETERKIYDYILNHHDEHLHGTVSELVEQFACDKVIFTGFLDGIADSLNGEKPDLENLTEDTEIDLDVDFEKLYVNMHKADADYLWSLDSWDKVFSKEKRQDIYDAYKRSRTYHAPKRPGRNDPCYCGSGKKYKNCCMKKDRQADSISRKTQE
jgi:hypothetical protein